MGILQKKAPYYRGKGPGVQGKRWPKYRYRFSSFKVRGGSQPSYARQQGGQRKGGHSHFLASTFSLRAARPATVLSDKTVKVALLQSEFYAKDFFELRIFIRKCSEILPEYFEPLFCGSEKISQTSRQISRQISQRKILKKFPDELLEERRAKKMTRDIPLLVKARPNSARLPVQCQCVAVGRSSYCHPGRHP